MATLYVGKDHAYRDEVSLARAESAEAAAQAVQAFTLDWAASLLFRMTSDQEDHYTTDDIEVLRWRAMHPTGEVSVLTVH